MEFSIVILSYNHPEITARAIESALRLVPSSMVLLVHNGSLKLHQVFLEKKFPEISHLILPTNLGFSGGANAGLRTGFIKSPWILFLTNDCELREVQLPTSGPALIAPLIWARREGSVDSIGGNFEINRAHLRHCRTPEDFLVAANPYVPGSAFWIHREVFEKALGFDETLGTYWEDVDFSLRIQQLGFPVRADLNTKVLHSIGKTCHKDSHYTTYLYQRNRKRISLKYSRRLGLSVWTTGFHLAKSWFILAGKNLKTRNWVRMKLLAKAILD